MWNLYLAGVRGGYNDTGSNKIICEKEFTTDQEMAVLDCSGRGVINLTYVNYGRTQPYSEVCCWNYGTDRTDCPLDTTITPTAKALCQGRQRCQLTYKGLDLRDTCPNTYKYFEVTHTCIKQGRKIRVNELEEFHPIHYIMVDAFDIMSPSNLWCHSPWDRTSYRLSLCGIKHHDILLYNVIIAVKFDMNSVYSDLYLGI